ncbi:hypothetical protein [Variovorax sp. J22R115]|uniref:hypothetical protein n=1 Tax=Variovorax sp. J22R115 TaxID=3053509 RepID=UPI002576AA0B|nr:hypothetical protein [Variovorax sp. J22R115]MDM0053743.1 hypothetical protein [Variovorax sp. J22R115]MDM0053815.1 hypothetical protein [Variovorax sp. J22R115]
MFRIVVQEKRAFAGEPPSSGAPLPQANKALSTIDPPPARLTSLQLREVSAQWRLRSDIDPQTASRVADVLDWLAAKREAHPPARSAAHQLRASLSQWMGF